MAQTRPEWGPWAKANPTDLARFASPEAIRLLRLDENAHDLCQSPDGRRALVQAIYNGLVGKRIRYSLEAYNPSPNKQRIRAPRRLLGTPVRGLAWTSLFSFAASAWAMSLYPS